MLTVLPLIPSLAQSPPTPPASPEANPTFTVPEAPKLSPEALLRLNQLREADRLYQAGNREAAIALYRQAKPNFDTSIAESSIIESKPAVTDITQLSPAAQVYWREAEAGIASKLEGRTFVPLKLLVEKYPEFTPGAIKLADAYNAYGQPENALAVLQSASGRYPNDTDLLQRRIQALAQTENWMEAAIAARQFALLNPTDPAAATFTQLADQNLQIYRKKLKQKLTGNAIGNVLTGALGYAVTGSLIGPLNSLQTSFLLLRGESALGASVAKQAKRALPIVTDEATNQYVNEIGAKLAKVAGREDFEYEFVVVEEPTLNAFALPGGKVFVNAGAIAKTQSEAELAGLLAHELAHAVLAHGLQLMTQGSLTANVTQFIPYVGGIAESAITFSYSRDMERQADAVGTRLLAAAGYPADGLLNLMQTLEQEEKADRDRGRPPEWLSSHPAGSERQANLKQLIIAGNYDRYRYEGIDRHQPIQQKMQQQLQAAEAKAKAAKQPKIEDKRQPKAPEPVPTQTPKAQTTVPTTAPTPAPTQETP
ncbi:MAG: hypothetical protein RLZZ511_1044 [Cyanobacteriota bacterium]|jgi:predicted Zn-dependent protease